MEAFIFPTILTEGLNSTVQHQRLPWSISEGCLWESRQCSWLSSQYLHRLLLLFSSRVQILSAVNKWKLKRKTKMPVSQLFHWKSHTSKLVIVSCSPFPLSVKQETYDKLSLKNHNPDPEAFKGWSYRAATALAVWEEVGCAPCSSQSEHRLSSIWLTTVEGWSFLEKLFRPHIPSLLPL